MQLQYFTTWDDGKRITRVSFLIADHAKKDERTEWIDAQLSLELPIVRNGALLREEVLNILGEKLVQLAKTYGSLVRP